MSPRLLHPSYVRDKSTEPEHKDYLLNSPHFPASELGGGAVNMSRREEMRWFVPHFFVHKLASVAVAAKT